MDFCEFVAPTEEEQQMRETAVERVSGVVQSIWPHSQVSHSSYFMLLSDYWIVFVESPFCYELMVYLLILMSLSNVIVLSFFYGEHCGLQLRVRGFL